MLALLLGGRLERVNVHTLRIDTADHMPDDAALACRVHRLQHEQHTAGSAKPALGEQTLLQVGESVVVAEQLLLGRLLVDARVRGGVDVSQDEIGGDRLQGNSAHAPQPTRAAAALPR